MKKTLTIIILTTILVLPLISAQWGGGYYSSPIEYLENEWVMFGILFILFFAVIFYTLNKAFKDNVVAGIIALGLSLLISLAIAQRGLIASYGLGDSLSSWILLAAALIGIGFLIRFAAESFGWVGTVTTLIILWLLIRFIEPSQILPDMLLNSRFYNFYDSFLRSGWGLVILGIIGFILSRGTKKTVKEISEIVDRARVNFRR